MLSWILAPLAVWTVVLASDFSDSLARNTLVNLAAAAYGDATQNQLCLDKHFPGAKLSLFAQIACDNVTTSDTCTGFSVIDDNRKFIAIAFRGTDGDAQFDLEIYTTLNDDKVAFRDGGAVGPYFNLAFSKIWDEAGLGGDFRRLAQLNPSYKLYITGHSLGGSLAAMAAVHIAKNKLFPAENIVFYSFGEPRTGDRTFANLLDSLLPQRPFRVIHNHDIIPHCPFQSMGYRHHSTEVWYANDMGPGAPYTDCVGQEDPNCSSKNQFELNFDPDHPHYYGMDVPAYGRSACTKTEEEKK